MGILIIEVELSVTIHLVFKNAFRKNIMLFRLFGVQV